MDQRGRKKSQGLEVVTEIRVIAPGPPDDLTTNEKELFRKITGSKPADWFDVGTVGLLAEYCRLQTAVDLMAGEINDYDLAWLKSDDGLKRYKVLSDVRRNDVAKMESLARAMRLTQQSRIHPITAGRKSATAAAPERRIWARD